MSWCTERTWRETETQYSVEPWSVKANLAAVTGKPLNFSGLPPIKYTHIIVQCEYYQVVGGSPQCVI